MPWKNWPGGFTSPYRRVKTATLFNQEAELPDCDVPKLELGNEESEKSVMIQGAIG